MQKGAMFIVMFNKSQLLEALSPRGRSKALRSKLWNLKSSRPMTNTENNRITDEHGYLGLGILGPWLSGPPCYTGHWPELYAIP